MRLRDAAALVILLAWGCVTCPDPTVAPPTTSEVEPEPAPKNDRPNMIYTSPADHDFSGNPQLLQRLINDRFQYFRFTNVEFAREVCARFGPQMRKMPIVNLHGDAHIEQYAVTSKARGLHDFDASTTGPAVLDLVRFGASLRVGCRTRGWEAHEDAMIDSFFTGYKDALTDPSIERPMPKVVTRIRDGFSGDRMPFLRWADGLMKPIDAGAMAAFERGFVEFVTQMKKEHPDLEPGYFTLKKVGRLHLGVGSALDVKLLIRVEGPTKEEPDDMILEAKEVRDLSSITCVNAIVGDAFRILIAQARMADVPPRFMAQIRVEWEGGAPFWVHEWTSDYAEIELANNLQTADELREVAYDVGAQLGWGHTRHVAAPLDQQLRKAQLASLGKIEPLVRRTIDELVIMTERGHEQFAREAGR